MIELKDMDKIKSFVFNFDYDMSVNMFGERLGKHLWNKYVGMDRDFLGWFYYLDLACSRKVLKVVNGLEC